MSRFQNSSSYKWFLVFLRVWTGAPQSYENDEKGPENAIILGNFLYHFWVNFNRPTVDRYLISQSRGGEKGLLFKPVWPGPATPWGCDIPVCVRMHSFENDVIIADKTTRKFQAVMKVRIEEMWLHKLLNRISLQG